MACSGHQFGLCRQFTYRTIIPPTPEHQTWWVAYLFNWLGSAGPAGSLEADVSKGVSAGRAATCPFVVAAGHFAIVWLLFPQNRHKLLSQHWCCSSSFSLPLALRCCSLGQSGGWLLWVCPVVVFQGGCCCLACLCSSWCSQYRLSWHIVTCTSSWRVLGFPRSAIWSFSHSGRPS